MARGFRDPRRQSQERLVAAPNLLDDADDAPLAIGELTRSIKHLLEERIGRVWIEGEISNFTHARSGHLYFSMKDDNASVRCVMWRSSAGRLNWNPEDGLKVTARGKLSVYEPRGEYQIVCDSLQPLGVGALQARFEELKSRLSDEGLFDAEHKRELPALPHTIGVVTSATGAALRDILSVLRRRFPGARAVLSSCRVQGSGAAEEIAEALQRLDEHGGCEVIIAGRGGGSVEDLWAFNEEVVARAIFACRTPVVSAVGHEVDFSIADLVADVRAATPTEAAELIVPDVRSLANALSTLYRRMRRQLVGRLEVARMELRHLLSRPVFRDPLSMVLQRAQRVDGAAAKLDREMAALARGGGDRLAALAGRLHALSPLAILARGYSMTWDAEEMSLVQDAGQVTIGRELRTRLQSGCVRSTVTAIEPVDTKD